MYVKNAKRLEHARLVVNLVVSILFYFCVSFIGSLMSVYVTLHEPAEHVFLETLTVQERRKTEFILFLYEK